MIFNRSQGSSEALLNEPAARAAQVAPWPKFSRIYPKHLPPGILWDLGRSEQGGLVSSWPGAETPQAVSRAPLKVNTCLRNSQELRASPDSEQGP